MNSRTFHVKFQYHCAGNRFLTVPIADELGYYDFTLSLQRKGKKNHNFQFSEVFLGLGSKIIYDSQRDKQGASDNQ